MADRLPHLGPALQGITQTIPKDWDKLVLADWTMPGHARVTGGAIKRRVDHKNKRGADGANPTFAGLEPQGITIELTTYSDEDREQLLNILDELPLPGKEVPDPNPGKGSKSSGEKLAVSIDHPSLRPIGITSVVIVGVSALEVVRPCVARIRFDLLHWYPTTEKVVVSTPTGAPVRQIKNNRNQANPSPTQQGDFGKPPMAG